MTWTATTDSPGFNSEPSWMENAVSIVDPGNLGAHGNQAMAQGYLWVQLDAPGPQHRGRLGLYIEECIETRLEERGALPPGIQASTGLDASLSDQLYRARLVEMRGIALGVPSLEGITNLGRTLDAEDSGVLRWWMAATAERPVRVVLSAENMRLRVYPSPVLFECLFDVAPQPLSPRVPSVSMAESAETMALSDLPPPVFDAHEQDEDDAVSFAEEPPAEEFAENPEYSPGRAEPRSWAHGRRVELPDLDRALGLTAEEPTQAPATLHAASPSEPLAAFEAAPQNRPWRSSGDQLDAEEFLRVLEEDSARVPEAAAAADILAEPAPVVAQPAATRPAPSGESPLPTKVIRAPFIRLAEPEELEAEPEQTAAPHAAEPAVAALAADAAPADAQRPVAIIQPPLDENDPFVQLARREWKTWSKNLEAARGPKPLAVVERQFVTDYTRLREAVRRGVADASAAAVLDAWQESFSTSYSEAFDALRVRGKRPTMVLDVPEIAQRLGRLQGARRVQLLLVDGMRFDLGLMVQERLRTRIDAALTERLLLWSALPSITTYQLELLGKGADGLREDCSTDESPALVARGRAASSPRRIRTGRLELFKIDVIEDALREAGAPVVQRLPEIAERTAEALADHLGKQAPRTLVLVFGDHGFLLDPKAAGTTEEVRQGGSSPEEVLVPAFAWLTGAVH